MLASVAANSPNANKTIRFNRRIHSKPLKCAQKIAYCQNLDAMIVDREQSRQITQKSAQQVNCDLTMFDSANAALQHHRKTNDVHVEHLPFLLFSCDTKQKINKKQLNTTH